MTVDESVMDDIVERLRRRDSEYVDGRPVTAPDYIALEAADEIERLRAELADAIKAICRAMASSAERRGRRLRWGSVSMTPLELVRFVRERIDTHGHDEQIVRALCTQAAVDETRRSAESDQDYMDGLAAMEWIKKRADELYAQIVRE